MDDTRDSASVDTVTLDDFTEEDLSELLGRILDRAEKASRHDSNWTQAAELRAQVEFWQAGRAQIIPEQWQRTAKDLLKELGR